MFLYLFYFSDSDGFLFSWTKNILVKSWPELKISSHCLLFLRFCHLVPEHVVVNITIKLFVPIWHVFLFIFFYRIFKKNPKIFLPHRKVQQHVY